MARDYAPRSPRRRAPARGRARPKQGLPGWLWMVVGLSLGLMVAAAVYIQRPAEPAGGEPRAADRAAPASTTARRASPALPPKEKPRFSFYEVLPSYEVMIPQQNDAAVGGKPAAMPAIGPGRYVIQAGSFRRQGDAESQKAKLALLGIESHVESVTIDHRDTVYRVRIGPIEDPELVQRTMQRLNANGVDNLLMRVKS